MAEINLEATERTPEIAFNFDSGTFMVRGESYPEDVTAFYGDLMTKLEDHLSNLSSGAVEFTFAFVYFNSSTAKVIMGLFDMLDEAAARGNEVSVIWEYEDDDDNMEELGEEFGEDLEDAKFEMRSIST